MESITVYPIVIHKDPDSDYGVTGPDMPGCFSAGSSFEQAIAMARQAVESHAQCLADHGQSVPMPKPIEAHQSESAYADGVWALVEVELAYFDQQIAAESIRARG